MLSFLVTRLFEDFTPLRPSPLLEKFVPRLKKFSTRTYTSRRLKYVGEPMSHLKSIASSAVRATIKVKASIIICFTSSGRAARLIAKYRPTMPVLSVVISRLKTNQLRWSFTCDYEARQSLIVRGLFPMLADPRHLAESTNSTNESVLKVALDLYHRFTGLYT